eukprot:756106-Hanusia_phi.AAC.1
MPYSDGYDAAKQQSNQYSAQSGHCFHNLSHKASLLKLSSKQHWRRRYIRKTIREGIREYPCKRSENLSLLSETLNFGTQSETFGRARGPIQSTAATAAWRPGAAE